MAITRSEANAAAAMPSSGIADFVSFPGIVNTPPPREARSREPTPGPRWYPDLPALRSRPPPPCVAHSEEAQAVKR